MTLLKYLLWPPLVLIAVVLSGLTMATCWVMRLITYGKKDKHA
jgi:hypothetical protein